MSSDISSQRPDDLVLGLNDRPGLLRWILLGLQHVVVAFAAMVGVPLAFAAAVGLGTYETTILVSGVLISGGIVTAIQTLGLGPFGARLPLVNAATFKFLGPMIIAYQLGGFPYLFGAVIVGGFAEIILALFARHLQKLFSPFLVGSFLIVIGVSLLPVGITSLFAVGEEYAGTVGAYVPAFLTLAVIAVAASLRFKGLRIFAVLTGFAIGYAVSAGFGIIDWAPVRDASWVGFFQPFALGVPEWPGITVVLSITVVYLVSFVETIGDTTAVSTVVTNKQPRYQRLRGSLMADGLSGPLASIFNAFPMTTYGQNIGLVRLTGVGSRFVVAMGAAIMIVMGLLPKFAALISVMPAPVLGAGLVMTFGIIATEGVRRAGPDLDIPRNGVVLTFGVAASLSVLVLPDQMIEGLPSAVAPFLSDAMIAGLLTTLVADLLIPGRSRLGFSEHAVEQEEQPAAEEPLEPSSKGSSTSP